MMNENECAKNWMRGDARSLCIPIALGGGTLREISYHFWGPAVLRGKRASHAVASEQITVKNYIYSKFLTLRLRLDHH